MQGSAYMHIFNLLDFADEIAGRITPEASNKEQYFMTLVYIEDILDKYGRSFVRQEAIRAGLPDEESNSLTSEVNRRMDELRTTLAQLVQQYDFDTTLDHKISQFQREWRKAQPLRGNDSPPTAWQPLD